MKKCTKCGVEKLRSDFAVSKGRISSWCRSCKREYDRNYKRTPDQVKKKADGQFNRRIKARQAIWEYKLEHPCIDCGENDPVVLDFDHRDDVDKQYDISKGYDKPWNKILLEIDKCDVRCANCHRRRTAIQRGYWVKVEDISLYDPFNLMPSEMYPYSRNPGKYSLWVKGYDRS